MPRRKVQTEEERLKADSLAWRLYILRDKAKMSLDEAAKQSGLTKNHIWHLETGRSTDPKLRTLRALAALYSVRVAYIIGEE